MKKLERRSYELRADMTSEGNGGFSGVANTMGTLDSYQSVFFPGAFRDALPEFLGRHGFVSNCHDWDEPIGMPTVAEERGKQLYVEAVFHSDADAQKVRTRMVERAARGLTSGISVGVYPDYEAVQYFSNGKALWDYALGTGANMALFDPQIQAYEDMCWAIPRVKILAEFGVVPLPGSPGSWATDVRSLSDLRDGSRAGLSLQDHLDAALAAVQGVTSRARSLAEERGAEGRSLGDSRLSQVRTLIAALTEICPEPRADETEWRRLQMAASAFRVPVT